MFYPQNTSNHQQYTMQEIKFKEKHQNIFNLPKKQKSNISVKKINNIPLNYHKYGKQQQILQNIQVSSQKNTFTNGSKSTYDYTQNTNTMCKNDNSNSEMQSYQYNVYSSENTIQNCNFEENTHKEILQIQYQCDVLIDDFNFLNENQLEKSNSNNFFQQNTDNQSNCQNEYSQFSEELYSNVEDRSNDFYSDLYLSSTDNLDLNSNNNNNCELFGNNFIFVEQQEQYQNNNVLELKNTIGNQQEDQQLSNQYKKQSKNNSMQDQIIKYSSCNLCNANIINQVKQKKQKQNINSKIFKKNLPQTLLKTIQKQKLVPFSHKNTKKKFNPIFTTMSTRDLLTNPIFSSNLNNNSENNENQDNSDKNNDNSDKNNDNSDKNNYNSDKNNDGNSQNNNNNQDNNKNNNNDDSNGEKGNDGDDNDDDKDRNQKNQENENENRKNKHSYVTKKIKKVSGRPSNLIKLAISKDGQLHKNSYPKKRKKVEQQKRKQLQLQQISKQNQFQQCGPFNSVLNQSQNNQNSVPNNEYFNNLGNNQFFMNNNNESVSISPQILDEKSILQNEYNNQEEQFEQFVLFSKPDIYITFKKDNYRNLHKNHILQQNQFQSLNHHHHENNQQQLQITNKSPFQIQQNIPDYSNQQQYNDPFNTVFENLKEQKGNQKGRAHHRHTNIGNKVFTLIRKDSNKHMIKQIVEDVVNNKVYGEGVEINKSELEKKIEYFAHNFKKAQNCEDLIEIFVRKTEKNDPILNRQTVLTVLLRYKDIVMQSYQKNGPELSQKYESTLDLYIERCSLGDEVTENHFRTWS